MSSRDIRVYVNDAVVDAAVEPRLLLVHFLRQDAGVLSAKVGCDTTSCGACTVLLDDRPVKSCTLFAVQADGCQVRSAEGLSADGEPLHPLQEAFREEHGLQCGYCTAGILMAAHNLVRDAQVEPTDQEVRETISGNICRCTGYAGIVAAIKKAASPTTPSSGDASSPSL
jgi:carbon-monoxide dehydrogenase small subunit